GSEATNQACVMTALSWVAGESWSDRLQCANRLLNNNCITANDAAGTITRLSNMGIEPFLTTSTLILIIAQRLIRKLCKECAEPYEVPFEVLATTGAKLSDVPDPSKVRLMRAKGCDKCGNTGYKGRQGIYEVLEMNDQIREMILERAPTHVLKMEARKLGMATLRQAGIKKVLAGVTTVEEVLRVTVADEVIADKEEIP
ncbi:MAG: ATPase, T2SS/T4P/T4SS family, partial [bacterium]